MNHIGPSLGRESAGKSRQFKKILTLIARKILGMEIQIPYFETRKHICVYPLIWAEGMI